MKILNSVLVASVFCSSLVMANGYRFPAPNEESINDIYAGMIGNYHQRTAKVTIPGKDCSITYKVVHEWDQPIQRFDISVTTSTKKMEVTIFGEKSGWLYKDYVEGQPMPKLFSQEYGTYHTCTNWSDPRLVETSCSLIEAKTPRRDKVVTRTSSNDVSFWQFTGGGMSNTEYDSGEKDRYLKIDRLNVNGRVIDSIECQFRAPGVPY